MGTLSQDAALETTINDLLCAAENARKQSQYLEGYVKAERRTKDAAKFLRIARNALTGLTNPELADAIAVNIAHKATND